MKNKLLQNVFYNYLYEIFLIIIPIITTPYVSRVLGASGIGTYSYTSSLITYFTTFSVLGLSGYGCREIAFYRDDKKKTSSIFFELQFIKTISVILFIIAWVVFSFSYKSHSVYMFAISPLLLSSIFDISWFYKGLEKFKPAVLINVFVKIISTIAIFSFVKNQNDLSLYIFILAISNFLGSALMWIFLPKNLVKTKINLRNTPNHLKQSFIYFLPSLALVLYSVLDKTLIGIITNDSVQNGYYEQAHKIVNLALTLCCGAVNSVMNSRMSYLYGTGNGPEVIKKKLNQSINFSLTLSIGFSFGMLAVANIFVPLFFGDGFAGSILLFCVFAPLPFICTFSNCLSSNYYTPCGRRKESAILYLIAAGVNLVFNLLFIPFLGALGATIGTIISEIFISIMLVLRSKGMFSFKDCLKYSYKKIIAGIIMFFSIYIIFLISNDTSSYMLFAKEFVVGVAIYFTILFALKDINFLDVFRGRNK